MSEDTCPKCKKGELITTDTIEVDGGMDGGHGFYPVECPSCGFEGKQYYKLSFSHFTDMDGNEI